MARKRISVASSDHEKWDKILNGLVAKMLKGQQEQLQTLLKDRKILEECIKMQQERWASDVRLLQDHISQLKRNVVTKEMKCLFEAKKSDLMTGLKQRETSIYKMKLAVNEDELADYRKCYDYLTRNVEGNSEMNGGMGAEVKRLKFELQKLTSEKSSEISFVWNQYDLLQKNLTSKLTSKQAELDQANEKIVQLLATAENNQSSNNEKDETMARLKDRVAEMDADKNELKEEISKLRREMELLRKSKTAEVTPVLRSCRTRAKTSSIGSQRSDPSLKKKPTPPAKAPVSSNEIKTVAGSSKRKPAATVPATPKLFTSSFKVPKLKPSSSPATFR